MQATADIPLRPLLLCAALGLSLAGCATVDPGQRFAGVRDAVGQRLNQNVAWTRDADTRRAAHDAVKRLLAEELTADEAVQIALLNNRRLQARFESLGIAQADLVEAGLPENPVLSLTVYSGDPGTNIEGAVLQDFISLLSLSVRKKIAGAQADRVTAEAAQAALDLAAEVKAQYYTVVGDAQVLELAQQVVTSTEAAAELAKRQYEAGTLSRREQAVQQGFYAQTVLEVAQAQVQLAADREKLNRLLGLWGEHTRWKTPSRLPRVPESLPSPETLEATSVAQRLDLLAAKKEAEAAAQALHLTQQFRYLSPLGIGVFYKREDDGENFFGPEIELGLPIFNQGQGRIARAEAEYRRSAGNVEALAVEIRSETREARDRLAAAQEAARHLEQALMPLQQSIVDETLKFYNGMLVGVYDLLLAQQGQVQTARQYVGSLKEFWKTWAELERALGGRIPFAEAATSRTGREAAANDQPNHIH
jgi:cobalt-zinc-cadmium efflux system outer membrane protein